MMIWWGQAMSANKRIKENRAALRRANKYKKDRSFSFEMPEQSDQQLEIEPLSDGNKSIDPYGIIG